MVEYEVSGIAGRPYLGGHLEIIKLKPGEFWLSPAKILAEENPRGNFG